MAPTNTFPNHKLDATAPLTGGFDITPDDDTDLASLPRAIMVGVGGDVAVTFPDGSGITLPGLVAGTIYPVRPARVLSTDTTATGIVGLY